MDAPEMDMDGSDNGLMKKPRTLQEVATLEPQTQETMSAVHNGSMEHLESDPDYNPEISPDEDEEEEEEEDDEEDEDMKSLKEEINDHSEGTDETDEEDMDVKEEHEDDQPTLINKSKPKKQPHIESGHKCPECQFFSTSLMALNLHQLIHLKRMQLHYCSYCGFGAPSLKSLQEHLANHFGTPIYRCSHCFFTTNKETEATDHLSEHKDLPIKDDPDASNGQDTPSVLPCGDCDFSTQDEDEYQSHLIQHLILAKVKDPDRFPRPRTESGDLIGEIRYSPKKRKYKRTLRDPTPPPDEVESGDNICPWCDVRFISQAKLQYHQKLRKAAFDFVCDICGDSSPYIKETMKHMQTICRVTKFNQCSTCHLFFGNEDNFQAHEKSHALANLYSCPLCNKTLPVGKESKDHTKLHLLPEYFKCSACDDEFTAKCALFVHRKSHKTEEYPYRCDQCDYKSKERYVMERHKVASHSVDRPYKCSVCIKSYKTKGHLQEHERKHKLAQSHRCDQCGKFFRSRENMISHQMLAGGQLLYPCDFCDYATYYQNGILEHFKSHDRAIPIQCMHCPLFFGETVSLDRHNEEHLDKDHFQCEFCSFSSSLDEAKSHLLTHTRPGQYECEQCRKSFGAKCALIVHRKDHVKAAGTKKTNKLQCYKCLEVFETEEEIRKHREFHKQEALKHSCSACDFKTTTKASLERHMRKHNAGDEPNICGVCGKGFKNAKKLATHEATHTEEKGFICDQCGKGFIAHPRLRKHQQLSGGELEFQCDICDYNTHFHYGILEHFKSHHQVDPPLQCGYCPAYFGYTKSLEDHAQVHQDSNGFQCPYCPLQCSLSDTKAHMLTHTSIAVFQCEQCPETTGSKCAANQHRLKHIKEGTPFKCPMCPYTATRPYLIRDHMTTHSDDRPYQCFTCGMTFKWPGVLKQHQKTHTEQGLFKCEVCDKEFSYSSSLQNHRKRRHSKKQAICQKCPSPNRSMKNGEFYCLSCSFTTTDRNQFDEHFHSTSCTGYMKENHACEKCYVTTTCEHFMNDHLRKYHHKSLSLIPYDATESPTPLAY